MALIVFSGSAKADMADYLACMSMCHDVGSLCEAICGPRPSNNNEPRSREIGPIGIPLNEMPKDEQNGIIDEENNNLNRCGAYACPP